MLLIRSVGSLLPVIDFLAIRLSWILAFRLRDIEFWTVNRSDCVTNDAAL